MSGIGDVMSMSMFELNVRMLDMDMGWMVDVDVWGKMVEMRNVIDVWHWVDVMDVMVNVMMWRIMDHLVIDVLKQQKRTHY